jgi:eukaryotic-like serine/threonine-protein kinase
MASLVNALVGEYLVTDLLGAGGMGEVYRAIHTHLGRVIAIKVLSAGQTDPNTVQRFCSEANIQASLRHPGVAEYLGFYEYQGRPCILMEFVDGETLSSILQQRGRLPADEALGIARSVAAVVAHFHKQGVLHRDIKSSNIKINSAGALKLLDFGIARLQTAKNLTRVGMVVGTPGILAPEQVRGQNVTPATDIWQLGILMYEMLSGRLPFEAEDPAELYGQILKAEITPVSRLEPSVPPGLEKIINRCLQKDPAKRFAAGEDLLVALQALERGKSAPAQSPAPSFARRFPLLRLGVIAASSIIVIALIVGALRGYHPSAQSPSTSACFEGSPSVGSPAYELMTVTLDTFEGPAQVFCNDQLVGKTPFSLRARIGDRVHVLLRRDGSKDLDKLFEVTERSEYTFVLDPVEDP